MRFIGYVGQKIKSKPSKPIKPTQSDLIQSNRMTFDLEAGVPHSKPVLTYLARGRIQNDVE